MSFLAQTIRIDQQYIKLEIWDTAGQERYVCLAFNSLFVSVTGVSLPPPPHPQRSLVPMYYRDAVAAVVVYDITSPMTFDVAKRWVEELRERADPHMVIAFVGNKTDLEPRRAVTPEQGADFVRSLEAAGVCAFAAECSAKSGAGVQDLFVALGRSIVALAKRSSSSSST